MTNTEKGGEISETLEAFFRFFINMLVRERLPVSEKRREEKEKETKQEIVLSVFPSTMQVCPLFVFE